ncbi:hypothetical protein Tco_1072755 [Tanacetum coccineum]
MMPQLHTKDLDSESTVHFCAGIGCIDQHLFIIFTTFSPISVLVCNQRTGRRRRGGRGGGGKWVFVGVEKGAVEGKGKKREYGGGRGRAKGEGKGENRKGEGMYKGKTGLVT